MEDLKRTIALLFRRKGQDTLTEKEFVFSASMDLRWFPPKDSQRLLEAGVKMGLLSLVEGKVSPAFELDEVEVPLDFTPTAAVLEEGEDLFQRLVDRISLESGKPAREVVARVNAVQASMGIYAEVAALLAGKHLGVDLEESYPEVEELLKQRRSNPGGG